MAFMAWGIGANDVANSFGTAFGSKCLTVWQACCIAAVCELAGAVLMGGHVSDTIRKGMMDIDDYPGDDGRVLIMAGMTSVLLAAAAWLLLASKYGLPVSTTHSAVGGVVAFAVASAGYGSVKWSKVLMIVASWFISPALSALVGFCSYMLLKRLVLAHDDSLRRARFAAPVLVFVMAFTVAMFTIYKGAKGIGLDETAPSVAIGISFLIGAIAAGVSFPFTSWHAKKLQAETDAAATLQAEQESEAKGTEHEAQKDPAALEAGQVEMRMAESVVDHIPTPLTTGGSQDALQGGGRGLQTESLFKSFVVIIAAFQSLAHGANDVANSVGPFGAVLAASNGPLSETTDIPIWVFLVAGFCIVVGLVMYGRHVMTTIGSNITEITPSKAFCAQYAATLVVLLATRMGIPISTTHAAVGGVVGVGIADGAKAVDWKVMSKVFGSWIMTLPICGVAAAGVYALFLPAVLGVS
eukprot:NODE_1053_length_2630_cov_28.610068.p1 GENE.NODE_1053_length_2630_cov_28.610068~~NODE_1053_length_2630_cov_28.610068.p1  ORF type:complete len:530 (-),score=75.69 NODE_1053_length_2630_cov_28.610068:1041-2444(-)